MNREYAQVTIVASFLVISLLYWYRDSLVTRLKPVAAKTIYPVDHHPKHKGLAGRDLLPVHLQHADQHNTELIKYIKDNWVFPPSSKPLILKKMRAVHYSQVGQSAYVDALLKQKTNGHFIECGAYDGEYLSNSLFFERQRNWSGILIEANPKSFQKLLAKNRHAHAVNACLSPLTTPVVLNFSFAGVMSGMTNFRNKGLSIPTRSIVSMQCLPLLSIMKATGIEHVDYFSLDVEGAEHDILRTIPLDEVYVGLFGVESPILRANITENIKTKAKIETLSKMLGKYNYTIIRYPNLKCWDTMLQRDVPEGQKNKATW